MGQQTGFRWYGSAVNYQTRLVDQQLDLLLDALPAIALEGAKGVGKTATGRKRAATYFSLDDSATAQIVAGNAREVFSTDRPVFIDEWQMVPSVWNTVRHAVDDGAVPGSFLLAGSANPRPEARVHSGAGRIVRLIMRPLSLPERQIESPTVSLGELLTGELDVVTGTTEVGLNQYLHEILISGFPGIRSQPEIGIPFLVSSYIDRIIDHDIEKMGVTVRRPVALRHWLDSYAAATGTTASYAAILAAATPGDSVKPNKATATSYRNLLERLFILDPLPAWLPTAAHLKRLGQSPKHHLVDPSLATHLSGLSGADLIQGVGPKFYEREGPFLGSLFESLAAQTVRILAQGHRANTLHFRVQGGEREVDLIVERPDKKVVAIEVKLSDSVRPSDVASLNWLEENANALVLDKVLLNTGRRAYRRPDGVAVIPLALLGP